MIFLVYCIVPLLLCDHLSRTDNFARTTKRQKMYQRKLIINKSGHNKQPHNKNTSGIKQTEPGLVAFYDIRSEIGAGLFLQTYTKPKTRGPHLVRAISDQTQSREITTVKQESSLPQINRIRVTKIFGHAQALSNCYNIITTCMLHGLMRDN